MGAGPKYGTMYVASLQVLVLRASLAAFFNS
jgi:hypothetical protein